MGNNSFRNKSGAIDCHITHLTRVKTIFRLRTRGTTYLCLKDDAYTDLYTAFATGELRTTPPSLPQFIRDVIFWRTWKEYVM